MDIEKRLDEAQLKQLKLIASMIAKGEPTKTVNTEWEGFIGSTDALQGPDVNELVQYVLRQSYLEQIATLQQYAERVRFFDEQKKAIGDRISTARSARERHIASLEEILSTTGDDAQLANIDLQSNLQKAQELLQTSSNVSKMLHDSATAVIRKMG